MRSLLALLTFNAPYLPWVLLGFSTLLGHDVSSDLLGIAVGHVYYFCAGEVAAGMGGAASA